MTREWSGDGVAAVNDRAAIHLIAAQGEAGLAGKKMRRQPIFGGTMGPIYRIIEVESVPLDLCLGILLWIFRHA
jgi:hypothetical protein